MRVQLALNVKNLDEAVRYYEKLLGAPASKRRPGYANFALDAPPLKLVLIESPEAAERLNHLGVEVFEPEAVREAAGRLEREGLAELVQEDTTCCYARQSKVWSVDPEGLRWEWYRVIADSEERPR